MNNETKALANALHKLAGNTPNSDPFAHTGAWEWAEWSESCRAHEEALKVAGVEL